MTGTDEAPPVRGQVKKLRVLLIATALSQVAHIRALAASERIRSELDLRVCTDIEGVSDYCAAAGLGLVDMRFRTDGRRNLGVAASFAWAVSAVFIRIFNRYAMPLRIRSLGWVADLIGLSGYGLRQVAVFRAARRVILREQIDTLLLLEENVERYTWIWTKVAKQLSIPSTILPFSIADELEAAEAYVHNAAHYAGDGWLNCTAARRYPQWVYTHNDRILLRLPGAQILASEAMGGCPPRPWLFNSSHAEHIAVESDATMAMYRRNGFPMSQLALTGSIVDDVLFEARCRSHATLAKLGLNQRDPIFLCSFPPDQMNTRRVDCEFRDYAEIVEFWMSELRKLGGWQVVVRPHPHVHPGDIASLRRFGFVVTDVDTAALIPLCTVYNASVSSTIRWALACGKPVVNFDVYQYRYRDFADEGAVRTIYSRQDFVDCIARIISDPAFLSTLSAAARETAPRWGLMDGRSAERIVELLRSDETGRPDRARAA